jgi:hypothetical protein
VTPKTAIATSNNILSVPEKRNTTSSVTKQPELVPAEPIVLSAS